MARIVPFLFAMAVPAMVIAETAVPEERAVQLERLVIQDCGSCHGLTMKGGLGSPITVDRMQHYDREALSEIVLDGIPGTAMPPWRALLTDAEALWIADYLRGAKQ